MAITDQSFKKIEEDILKVDRLAMGISLILLSGADIGKNELLTIEMLQSLNKSMAKIMKFKLE